MTNGPCPTIGSSIGSPQSSKARGVLHAFDADALPGAVEQSDLRRPRSPQKPFTRSAPLRTTSAVV